MNKKKFFFLVLTQEQYHSFLRHNQETGAQTAQYTTERLANGAGGIETETASLKGEVAKAEALEFQIMICETSSIRRGFGKETLLIFMEGSLIGAPCRCALVAVHRGGAAHRPPQPRLVTRSPFA